jgi:hypothetical protein
MRKLLAVLPLLLSLSGCGVLCTNQTVTSLQSPDGKHRAILFMRECGATTDYTTQVSVVASAWPFHDIGNVFIADGYDRDVKRGSWGGPWAEISWVSSQQLLVTYDAHSRIFTQNATAHGVRITYRLVHR